MTTVVPKKEHLREVLLYAFRCKKTAAEAHRMLLEAYGEHALSERTCRDWFQRFKIGDVSLDDKERGRPEKKFKDDQLQALLDVDLCQTQQQLAVALEVGQATISKRLRAIAADDKNKPKKSVTATAEKKKTEKAKAKDIKKSGTVKAKPTSKATTKTAAAKPKAPKAKTTSAAAAKPKKAAASAPKKAAAKKVSTKK